MECSRRGFFAQFGQSLVSAVTPDAEEASRESIQSSALDAAKSPPTWLRPPGALPEERFRAVCTRCTACQEACPHDSIRRLGSEFGDDAGTPAIIPLESPCYLCEDMPCIIACRPGALQPRHRADARMGLAVLARDRCYQAQGQPCDYCILRCPLRGVAIAFGDGGVPAINEEACTGCGVCAYLCPGDAITIAPARSADLVAPRAGAS